MLKTTSKLISTTLLAFCLSAPLLAHAQDKSKDMSSGEMCQNMEQNMQKKWDEFKPKLNLTSAQQTSWRTMMDSLKIAREPLDKICQAPMDMKTTAFPERLDRHDQMATAIATYIHNSVQPIKTFYATLTPDQQKIMDKEFHPFMGHEQMQHKY